MRRTLLLFICAFSSRLSLPEGTPYEFIVWNVGQGSWSTLKTAKDCFHFDLGGEANPLPSVRKACDGRMNRLYFSHWDWDHISFAASARNGFTKVCLAEAPGGPTPKKRTSILNGLSACPPTPLVERIDFIPPKKASANDHSKIFIVLGRILISGDSSAKMEKIWLRGIPRPGDIEFLLLGHHGSRTSTSQTLLEYLPNLKKTVASARNAKYGHPHPLVIQRLRASGIPQLSTEDWGHLHFDIEGPSTNL